MLFVNISTFPWHKGQVLINAILSLVLVRLEKFSKFLIKLWKHVALRLF